MQWHKWKSSCHLLGQTIKRFGKKSRKMPLFSRNIFFLQNIVIFYLKCYCIWRYFYFSTLSSNIVNINRYNPQKQNRNTETKTFENFWSILSSLILSSLILASLFLFPLSCSSVSYVPVCYRIFWDQCAFCSAVFSIPCLSLGWISSLNLIIRIQTTLRLRNLDSCFILFLPFLIYWPPDISRIPETAGFQFLLWVSCSPSRQEKEGSGIHTGLLEDLSWKNDGKPCQLSLPQRTVGNCHHFLHSSLVHDNDALMSSFLRAV